MAADREISDKIKGPWSSEEDEALEKLVNRLGPRNWSLISRSIPGRSGKSCRLRWCNQLSPEVEHRPFTAEEDGVILKAHGEFGNKWATIAKMINGRTDNAIKNHWNSTLKRRISAVGGVEERPSKVLRRRNESESGNLVDFCFPVVRKELKVCPVESPPEKAAEDESIDGELTALTLCLPGTRGDSCAGENQSTKMSRRSESSDFSTAVAVAVTAENDEKEKKKTTSLGPEIIEVMRDMIKTEVRNYISGLEGGGGILSPGVKRSGIRKLIN